MIQIEHDCNPYCADNEHCELVYTDDRATEGAIWQAMGFHRGLKITRVEPAKEAPDPAAQPPERMDSLTVGSRPLSRAWLAWWRS